MSEDSPQIPFDDFRVMTASEIESVKSADPEIANQLAMLDALFADPESERIFNEARRMNGNSVSAPQVPIPTCIEDALELSEDVDSGLVWAASFGKVKAGEMAGTWNEKAGWRIGFANQQYLAKNIVWRLYWGSYPEKGDKLTFLDGNMRNCRISNINFIEASSGNSEDSQNPSPSPAIIQKETIYPDSDFIYSPEEFLALWNSAKDESPKLISKLISLMSPYQQAAIIKLLQAVAD